MKGNIFIKRPVMALSISVLILIVGFISLYTLPVEQYPDIAPPTVRVEATYTGVNADAVIAVYPFTPQPRIVRAVISVADMPVFCGVGGGFTSGARSVAQAMEAEHCGA